MDPKSLAALTAAVASAPPPPYAETSPESSAPPAPAPAPDSNNNKPQHPTPVPISQLRLSPVEPHPTADANGVIVLHYRPTAEVVCLMCPLFCCMGCCWSRSSNITFNEIKQTIVIETWAAYCICDKSIQSFQYSDIANFAATPSSLSMHKQKYYYGTVITRTGQMYELTDPMPLRDVGPVIMSWQRIVFGESHTNSSNLPNYWGLIVS